MHLEAAYAICPPSDGYRQVPVKYTNQEHLCNGPQGGACLGDVSAGGQSAD